MNIENLKKVRDVIANQPHVDSYAVQGFNMARYLHPCGTPSCIAGFSVAVKHNYDMPSFGISPSLIADEAAEWLGLDDYQSTELFCGLRTPLETSHITSQQAVTVIDSLIETGEVDWGVAGVNFEE